MDGIGIIRMPPPNEEEDASRKAIENISEIALSQVNNVFLFERRFNDMEKVECTHVEKRIGKGLFSSIIYHIIYQIELSMGIFSKKNEIDAIFWHAGGFSLIIPMILSKLLGISPILVVTGVPTKGFKNESFWGYKSKILPKIVFQLEKTACLVSDIIVIFTDKQKNRSPVNKYREKTVQFRFNYQEMPEVVTDYSKRGNKVVYLGRLHTIKGTDTLARGIKLLLESDREIIDEVILIGDGPLKKTLVEKFSNFEKVKITGWLNRTEAMACIADARAFVLPSNSEGLPKALLETMARGVVPIVSPVGSIPDVVTHGENGILLNENSPKEVKEEILKFLQSGNQECLSKAAQQKIDDQFSKQKAESDFRQITDLIEKK